MNHRWLLNENFPQPAVARLRSTGQDVLAIAELAPGITDPEVMALACREARWLVTFDRDYGELVFRRNLTPPPLILLLRVHSYQPDEPAGWLETLLMADELRESHFHIYDGETVRRRPFLTPIATG